MVFIAENETNVSLISYSAHVFVNCMDFNYLRCL